MVTGVAAEGIGKVIAGTGRKPQLRDSPLRSAERPAMHRLASDPDALIPNGKVQNAPGVQSNTPLMLDE